MYFTVAKKNYTVLPSLLLDITEGKKVVKDGKTIILLNGWQHVQAITMLAEEGE